jgi:hypothetical protein
MLKERGWEKYWDDTSSTPYAVNKRKFISYDDVDSFKAKVGNLIQKLYYFMVHANLFMVLKAYAKVKTLPLNMPTPRT